jgi:hypothetical protein
VLSVPSRQISERKEFLLSCPRVRWGLNSREILELGGCWRHRCSNCALADGNRRDRFGPVERNGFAGQHDWFFGSRSCRSARSGHYRRKRPSRIQASCLSEHSAIHSATHTDQKLLVPMKPSSSRRGCCLKQEHVGSSSRTELGQFELHGGQPFSGPMPPHSSQGVRLSCESNRRLHPVHRGTSEGLPIGSPFSTRQQAPRGLHPAVDGRTEHRPI